jgi:hypothetical protein
VEALELTVEAGTWTRFARRKEKKAVVRSVRTMASWHAVGSRCESCVSLTAYLDPHADLRRIERDGASLSHTFAS